MTCRWLTLFTLLFTGLSAPLLRADTAGPAGPLLEGRVVWVYDGDTLEIAPHGKVRLIGIDVPEQKASARDRYLLAQGVTRDRLRSASAAARRFAIEHVKGEEVTIEPGSPRQDRHGRLLAYVYLADGRLLNRLLLERGLAVVYRRFTFREKAEFLAAEATARASAAGLWGEGDL